MPQLLEAYEIWRNGQYGQSSAYEFRAVATTAYTGPIVAAGQALLLEYIDLLHFPENDIIYLGSLRKETGKPYVDEGFLNYLQRFKFQCNIDAVAEGSVVWPGSAILRMEGPLIQIVLIRKALMGLMSQSSWLTTFAAGWGCPAAVATDVLCPDDALMLARAFYLTSGKPTNNILVGKVLGIPVSLDESPLQTPAQNCPIEWELTPVENADRGLLLPMLESGKAVSPAPADLHAISLYCQSQIGHATL